mmetsp:Transcript_46273/g.121380  ORF Transcript_46273/g.121380 Transcript_46273/m.121380 type:complete len:267 (+) Transcript_46273:515-1315(+)
MTISYEVMQTSKPPGTRSSAMRRARSSLSPWKCTTLNTGAQFLNSRTQFVSVDLGASTRYGALYPFTSRSQQRSEIHWSVLPRPISSARMPLIPFWYRLAIQFSPAIWYCRRLPKSELIRSGCFVTRIFSSKPSLPAAASLAPSISSSSSFSVLRPFFFCFLFTVSSSTRPKCLKRSDWPRRNLRRCLDDLSMSPITTAFCSSRSFSSSVRTLAFLGALGLSDRAAASASMRARFSARSCSRSDGPAAAVSIASRYSASSSERAAW